MALGVEGQINSALCVRCPLNACLIEAVGMPLAEQAAIKGADGPELRPR